MPRSARLDAPGTLHHVILRGIEKRQIVDDKNDQLNFVTRMGNIALETGTEIYAWALMTNHAHILLQSSEFGLPGYMRRLLTGYAVSYNRRHHRHGHLFQNRYKSIVCEEETYFLELIRYIHLNPLRAGLVHSMSGLDHYHWCGHGVLMGRYINEWQNREYVLGRFGEKETDARAAYRKYMSEGVEQGKRPDLVGGGLVRSMGGWSEVKAMRLAGIEELADDRILGSGQFVKRIIKESEGNIRLQFAGADKKEQIDKVIQQYCNKAGIHIEELQAGGRRGQIALVRKKLIQILVKEIGVSLAVTARHLGVSTSAVSKSLMRKIGQKSP